MGSYPELCAKCNFYLCPFVIGISEFRTVSLVGHLPILGVQFEHSNSLWLWVWDHPDNRYMHPAGRLPYIRIFSGDLKSRKTEILQAGLTRYKCCLLQIWWNLMKFDKSKIRPIRCRPLFIESFLILSGLKISNAWEFVSTSVAANQIKDVEALLCLDKRLRMEDYFRTKDPLVVLKILELVSFTCKCGTSVLSGDTIPTLKS